ALASSIAGVRSIYSSKHVGLNVAMDPLMTSAYVGVNAGFVVVSADDPGIHSSQNEQDNRLLARVAKIPLLEPSSPAEAYRFVKSAFQISEKFDTPVMVRMTTRICHTKENIVTGRRREIPKKDFAIDVPKYVMVPRNAFRRHIELERRLVRLRAFAEKTPLNAIEVNDKKIGFITGGVTYLYAKEMYPDASFLKLGMTHPFPADLAGQFAKKVKNIFVIEELEPYLEDQLLMAGIRFRAKDPSYRIGELRPEDIPQIVKGKSRVHSAMATRKPVMCPGCPHRAVFSVLKKLRLAVTGDIGCYTLGALPPLGALHSCLCMGGGVTFFEGFKKVIGQNVVGVIGDSTFVHSGVTGLINAAYNQAQGVIIILDNSTTAMTGSQPHPAVGINAKGKPTKKLILEDLCRSCGADSVEVVAAAEVKKLEALLKEKVNAQGLSVIIVRTACRLLEKKRQAAPVYHPEKCKRCFLCLGIDCPALTKTDAGTVTIDNKLCIGCNLCVEVCALGALTKDE
ncbi:MAG: thiamine pyrophosphate-dependent enzyme, partial [Candidatus Omnitrophica bacterium]|nr:thiamine pyrophosphate-dependent enzyme [Candidatus Omnitrophota bacterium]